MGEKLFLTRRPKSYGNELRNLMKTFTETKGRRPFNWFAALKDAKAGLLSPEELANMRGLAGEWVTCACGNLCERIPRMTFSNAPEDPHLAELGSLFYDYVDGSEWKEAMETLVAIEKRADEVLKELDATPTK